MKRKIMLLLLAVCLLLSGCSRQIYPRRKWYLLTIISSFGLWWRKWWLPAGETV